MAGSSSEHQSDKSSASSSAPEADVSPASNKLAELMQRAQAGDHHAMAQLRHLRQRRRKQQHGASAPKADVSFSEEEAGAVPMGKEEAENPLEMAVGGGEKGLKEGEPGNPYEGDTIASEGVGKTVEDMASKGVGHEVIRPHGIPDVAVHGEEEGLGKTAGLALAARALLIPRLVSLLRAHKWKDAVTLIRKSVGAEECVEIAKKVVEKLGGELSAKMAARFITAAAIAGAADAAMLGWEWFELGINAIHEAHEHGDRNSANAIFAWAYADTLLNGSHQNPGAVTAEQREAMEKGIEMGNTARAEFPELPFLLKAEYGDGNNAKHAIEDALLTKAGISVRTTHGR